MRYVGNLSESAAVNYADRTYTHSTTHKGVEVRWYDCWAHDDEPRPAFGEALDQKKVRELDRIYRRDPDEDE